MKVFFFKGSLWFSYCYVWCFFVGFFVIYFDECIVENIKINFVWFFLENGNVDSYIVEIDFLDWEGDIY